MIVLVSWVVIWYGGLKYVFIVRSVVHLCKYYSSRNGLLLQTNPNKWDDGGKVMGPLTVFNSFLMMSHKAVAQEWWFERAWCWLEIVLTIFFVCYIYIRWGSLKVENEEKGTLVSPTHVRGQTKSANERYRFVAMLLKKQRISTAYFKQVLWVVWKKLQTASGLIINRPLIYRHAILISSTFDYFFLIFLY